MALKDWFRPKEENLAVRSRRMRQEVDKILNKSNVTYDQLIRDVVPKFIRISSQVNTALGKLRDDLFSLQSILVEASNLAKEFEASTNIKDKRVMVVRMKEIARRVNAAKARLLVSKQIYGDINALETEEKELLAISHKIHEKIDKILRSASVSLDKTHAQIDKILKTG